MHFSKMKITYLGFILAIANNLAIGYIYKVKVFV